MGFRLSSLSESTLKRRAFNLRCAAAPIAGAAKGFGETRPARENNKELYRDAHLEHHGIERRINANGRVKPGHGFSVLQFIRWLGR
jgi:hypothetical protein